VISWIKRQRISNISIRESRLKSFRENVGQGIEHLMSYVAKEFLSFRLDSTIKGRKDDPLTAQMRRHLSNYFLLCVTVQVLGRLAAGQLRTAVLYTVYCSCKLLYSTVQPTKR